jgi:hypothetical protein|tara:strand:+ start:430 stop:600 length:171 start_codon:yes stop_codon:yes gene_type:complete
MQNGEDRDGLIALLSREAQLWRIKDQAESQILALQSDIQILRDRIVKQTVKEKKNA